MNAVSFLIKALIIGALVSLYEPPGTNAIFVGYDCKQTTHISTLPLSGVLPSCNTITTTTARTILAEIYEEKSPKTVIGYHCRVRYKEEVADLQGGRKYSSEKTVIIGRGACMETHENGLSHLENRFLHHNRPTVPNERSNANYEVTLSEHVGLVNLEQNLVQFDNGVDCDFDSLSCSDDYFGDMAWSLELQQELSPLIFGGNITLVTTTGNSIYPSETFAVMPDLVAFKVLDNALSFRGKVVFRTRHPDLYIKMTGNIQSKLSYGISYNMNTDGNASVNNANASHVRVAKKLCLQNSRISSSYCASSVCILDTPQQGIVAERHLSSAEVDVKLCTRKVVRRRKTSECFREIPVMDSQDRPRFLKLGSRILVDRAEEIECEPRTVWTQKFIPAIGEESSKSRKKMPEWIMLIVIALLGAWGLLGIVQSISLIKSKSDEDQHRVDQDKESAVRSSQTKSFLQCFLRLCVSREDSVENRWNLV